MAAPILLVDAQHAQPRHVARAVTVLQNGGLIAYPTDTFYAYGCDLFSKKGTERLYHLKGRPKDRPLTFVCADLSDLSRYASVTNFAHRVLRSLTPGAFTFILDATRLVPDAMRMPKGQVGIRVPDSPLVRTLAAELGHPLTATSATDPEGVVLTDAHDVKQVLGQGVDLILDGGVQLNEPSTVVSLVGDQLEVLRQGKGIVPILE